MKAAFIINPHSAKGNYRDFIKKLTGLDPKAVYHISKSASDTGDFIQRHPEVDVFVAVGGDGTISTVAQHLVETEKVLGIYPAGSGNGFANETHFDKNLPGLLDKIKRGEAVEIDTFTVNGRLSINVAGVGLDGAVIERFEKTSRGFLNYIKTSLQTFFDFQPIRVHFDGELKRYDGSYLMVNIANTRQFGNKAYIAPWADHTDGLLEIVLVRKFPFWMAPQFVYRMFTKNLRQSTYLQHFHSEALHFTIDNSAAWHLDGEGNHIESPIEIHVQKKSLRVLK